MISCLGDLLALYSDFFSMWHFASFVKRNREVFSSFNFLSAKFAQILVGCACFNVIYLLTVNLLIVVLCCFADQCRMPLGAEDGRLVPGSFSASTYYNHYLAPWHGRLNHRWSWSARYRRHGQWMQISFGGSATVKGIASQGRQDANQWVTQYTLGRSTDGMKFYPYHEGRGTMVKEIEIIVTI